jgi:hypothetical protein
MPGAGGGLAYNTVVSERNDDADLIIAASSATTTRLAQNAYAGMTADQVRFVGAIGADPGVIVVAADSPFQSLGDLVDAIKAEPGSVAFAGGSAVGGFDHLKPLMILKEAGFTDITKIKYIGLDGGADAITQTVGGFRMHSSTHGLTSCSRLLTVTLGQRQWWTTVLRHSPKLAETSSHTSMVLFLTSTRCRKSLGSCSSGLGPNIRSDHSDHGGRVYRGRHADSDEFLLGRIPAKAVPDPDRQRGGDMFANYHI